MGVYWFFMGGDQCIGVIGIDSRRCGLVGVASFSAHIIIVAKFAAMNAFVFKRRAVFFTCRLVPSVAMTFFATPAASVLVICLIVKRGLFIGHVTGQVISFVGGA